jgi:gliding motility-associated-like protein
MPQYLKLLLIVILFLSTGLSETFAQECACPPASACKPCSGGYTSVTLRYNGTASALVLVIDGRNTLIDLTVSPLQEFTLRGSKQNEKFVEKSVPILVNGLTNILLGSSCGDLQVGLTYGAFTITAAESMGGSIVCCTTPPSDLIAPVFTEVASSISVEATTGCGAQVLWPQPIALDNCTQITLTSSHASGEVFPPGTTTVVYTATDQAGNISNSSFTVTVSDRTPPIFTGGPANDILLSAGASCSAIASWDEPEVINDCNITIKRSHEPNTTFSLGTTKVQYEARDASGNTSFFSFNVIVNDRTQPQFRSFPSDITVVAGPNCSATVAWLQPVVTDECSGVRLTSTHETNSIFPLGVTKVKFVATDNSGNTTGKELTIVVEDKNPVEIINCPNDINLTVEEDVLSRVSWAPPVAAPACELVTLESNYRPEDLFSLGSTNVEYVASTASGKIAHCTFDVIIALEEKPLNVSKLITPDGDGVNDQWILVNIEDYRDNQVMVVDRWGGVVYQASRYDNESVVWRGINRSGVSVPTGTYFYTITAYDGKRRIQRTGSVELVR